MKGKTLIQKLEKAGFKPRSYSGRGMYGRECVGTTLRQYGEIATVGVATKGAGNPSIDEMGPGIIAYWPRIDWPEEQEG